MIISKGYRNAVIEFMRFFAISAIVFFHTETYYFQAYHHFDYGYIFVEFFFILTGFFAMMKISQKDEYTNIEVFGIFKNKIKSFYLQYLVSFAISFLIICIYVEKIKISEIFPKLLNYKWEIFGLQFSGFLKGEAWGNILNIPAWYISSLIISFALFCVLAAKFRKVFIYLIAPVTFVLTYATFINQFGTLDLNIQLTNICGLFFVTGNMRAFASMCFGAICYYLYKNLNNKKYAIKTRIVATIGEIFLLFSLLFIFIFNDLIVKEDLLLYLPIFGALIILGFSDIGFISSLLNRYFNKIPKYLGSLSMYIFLLQYPIIVYFIKDFKNMGYLNGMLSIYAVTIILCVIIKGLFDVVKKLKK